MDRPPPVQLDGRPRVSALSSGVQTARREPSTPPLPSMRATATNSKAQAIVGTARKVGRRPRDTEWQQCFRFAGGLRTIAPRCGLIGHVPEGKPRTLQCAPECRRNHDIHQRRPDGLATAREQQQGSEFAVATVRPIVGGGEDRVLRMPRLPHHDNVAVLAQTLDLALQQPAHGRHHLPAKPRTPLLRL